MIDPIRPSTVRHAAIATFVLAAAASRLLPHPPNFTAVPAMALFSGACFGRNWLAFAAPIVAMALSDLALGAFIYGAEAFSCMVPVYVCMAITVAIGFYTKHKLTSITSGAVLSTAVFFTVTNFCVWWFSSFYSQTSAGLIACYVAALPFAGSMLASTLLFAVTMSAAWRLVERLAPSVALAR